MLLLLLNCQNFSLKGQHFKTADFCRWCFRCARRHSVSFCPAINAQCRNCLKLHHFARASHTRLEPESRDVITPVTSVPSVTNVYHFFMNRRVAGRFVCCGFVYVIVCYGAANCQCCRAPLFSRVVTVYGTAHFVPVSFACCHAPWCRARGQMVSSYCIVLYL